MTFSDVAVGGGPDGEPAMTVETFSMDAELAPFMRGEFLIFDMRLVQAEGDDRHRRRRHGRLGDAAVGAVRRGQISLEKLTVTEGQSAMRHAASGRTHRLIRDQRRQCRRSRSPGRGAWSARCASTALRTAVTRRHRQGGGDGQHAAEDHRPIRKLSAVSIETDGNVRFDGAAAEYAGDVPGSAARRERRPTAKRRRRDEGPGFRLNGKFSLDHERLAFDEFLFETGPLDNPYTADGKAFVDLGAEPRFAIAPTARRCVSTRRSAPKRPARADAGASGSQRLRKRCCNLPKPTIPGTVDVNLPAVVAGDTTIRDVRLSAEPAEAAGR